MSTVTGYNPPGVQPAVTDGFAFDPLSTNIYARAALLPMSTRGFPAYPSQTQPPAAIGAACRQPQHHQQQVSAPQNCYGTQSSLRTSDGNSTSPNGIGNSATTNPEPAQFRTEAALNLLSADPRQMSFPQDAQQTPPMLSFDDPIAAAMRAAMITPFGVVDQLVLKSELICLD